VSRSGPKRTKIPRPTARDPGAGFEIPSDLSREARTELDRLVGRLRAAHTYSHVDPQVVLSLARINLLLDKAFSRIEADGVQIKAHNGMDAPHPLTKTVNSLSLRQKSLLRELGLIDPGLGAAEPPAAAPAAQEDDGRWAGLLTFGSR
jgi:hypothetical protein